MKEICIVGSGYMASEHARAAKTLGYESIYVVGRTLDSFKSHIKSDHDLSSVFQVVGGVDAWLTSEHFKTTMVHINAVSVEALASTSLQLIDAGVQRILLEKPGALSISNLNTLQERTKQHDCNLRIAYNRRHYLSVRKLQEILKAEGASSFEFEFTEWVDRIDHKKYAPTTLTNWLIANSAHVIDTAFYLAGGLPNKLNACSSGKNQIAWHPRASVFVGSGTANGIPFNYSADWTSQGRWKIHFRNSQGKYLLEPMEQLQFIPKNSIHAKPVKLQEEKGKPGLAEQIHLFERGDTDSFCSLADQISLFSLIEKIISGDTSN
jgi:predicted dehydrogenase